MAGVSVNVLGIKVSSHNVTSLIDRVMQLVVQNDWHSVMYANVHTLNSAYFDPDLRGIMRAADIVYCDGAGVVLGARLLGQRLSVRMTGADWIEHLCSSCVESGTTLYFLGGQIGVAVGSVKQLQTRHPGLRVVGAHHGYLGDPAVCAAAVKAINDACPDILLVGMGTPIQEKWIAVHRTKIDVPVVWAVGALFDFVANVQPRGPRWMLDSGLEWLYRLFRDPRRLWRRYLVGNPLFILRVLKQRITR